MTGVEAVWCCRITASSNEASIVYSLVPIQHDEQLGTPLLGLSTYHVHADKYMRQKKKN